MNILSDFCFLCSDSCRTRAYISALLENGLLPKYIIYVQIDSVAQNIDRKSFKTNLFDNESGIDRLSSIEGVEIITVQAKMGINESSILDALRSVNTNHTIFSIPGRILGEAYFDIPTKYLHIHPGRLPEYRGSTPFYYSVLNEGKITATALFLQPQIDQGPIIMTKDYPLPKNDVSLDLEYDPWIRASLLIDVLNAYIKENKFPDVLYDTEKGTDYYVIHPVLKCIAINKINSLIIEENYNEKR